MATASSAPSAVLSPDVAQADLEAFQAQHFSGPAIDLFDSDFLQVDLSHPPDQQHDDEYYEEDDDGLGYYPDGVKRTLTDEQIAIFRHSEIEALRRAQERGGAPARNPVDAEVSGAKLDVGPNITPATEADDVSMRAESEEEGELESDTPRPTRTTTATASKKKKKKNNKSKRPMADGSNPQRGEHGWFRKNVKPDLRKRTWDVVEAGMDSLDYDGLEAGAGADASRAAQRRQISYDD